MREEFIGFEWLEDALDLIFDELPGMKTSSVVHKPGVGSGIQIGSRRVTFTVFDDFLERVKFATVKLRLRSREHYQVIYEWYRTNDHENESDFGTGLGFVNFHKLRLEALDQLSRDLSENDHVNESEFTKNESEPVVDLQAGDPLVIIGGAPNLVGQVAYFDKFISDFRDRLICNYIIGGQRVIYEINLSEIRPV